MSKDLEMQIRDLVTRHNKMLSFIRSLADESCYETYENLNELNWVACDVLDDLGLLKDE